MKILLLRYFRKCVTGFLSRVKSHSSLLYKALAGFFFFKKKKEVTVKQKKEAPQDRLNLSALGFQIPQKLER